MSGSSNGWESKTSGQHTTRSGKGATSWGFHEEGRRLAVQVETVEEERGELVTVDALSRRSACLERSGWTTCLLPASG